MKDSGLTLTDLEMDEEANGAARVRAVEGEIRKSVAIVQAGRIPEGGFESLQRPLLLAGDTPARLGVTDAIVNRLFTFEVIELDNHCVGEHSHVMLTFYDHVRTVIARQIGDRAALAGLQTLANAISNNLRRLADGFRVRAEQGSAVHLRILRDGCRRRVQIR